MKTAKPQAPTARTERAAELADSGVRSTTPEPPYLWIHKPALDKIREGLDGTNSITDAIALYTVLCEIASDKASSTFTTTQSWLALKSGLSTRTVRRRLPELVELGVVEVDTPELKAPSTYALLPIGQPVRTIGPERKQRVGHDLKNSEVSCEAKSKKNARKLTLLSIVLPKELDTPEFKASWQRLQQHLSELGKCLTPTSAELQLHQLLALGHDGAIEAIERCISNGWRNLHPCGNQARTPKAKKPRKYLGRYDRDNPPVRSDYPDLSDGDFDLILKDFKRFIDKEPI